MGKRIKAIGMVLIMLVLSIGNACYPIPSAQAAEQIQVNIHYHRYAKDFEGWNVWSWAGSGEGAAFEFNGEDDFGLIATYNLEIEEGTDTVGFIVRHSTESNTWDAKDTASDRFFDITKVKDGVIDIYLIQDEAEFGYGEDEMNIAAKIMGASLTSSKTIDIKVSSAFDSTAKNAVKKIKVTDSKGKEYAVKDLTSKDGAKAFNMTITMKDELSLLNQYTITVKGYGEFKVSNGKIFSTKEFEDTFYYDGDDLGAVYTKDSTAFRVWAPTATEVLLNLYTAGVGTNLIESIPMTKDVKGTWIADKSGDLNGTYYTYTVTAEGKTNEAVDPYAKAAGVNGGRGMVVDLDSTDPDGFIDEQKPEFVNATDAVLYELHIRDFSIDSSSGIKNKGKYLAFTEKGTTTASGMSTGIDYLVDLGITHVHLLPSFDYASVDETKLINNQFNWGYDPENYNVPEGSYSTDPHHGEVRINEYKQMVESLHESGIRVVMDVVYNHTSANADSNFNKIVPGYYYRMTEDGNFSNSSGCGNETASEQAMMRKFIVDSVVYWATEYHIDGFRFDLMGIHDTLTMNEVRAALNEVDPTIIVYGEGWTSGASTLDESERALKVNMMLLDAGIAAFSDDIRDGIKGSVFEAEEKGFISGQPDMEETIKFGVVAATENDQVDYTKVNYSTAAWAKAPIQTITYASAHDNLTLWDKIASSNASDSMEDRIKMNLLSSAIVLTSQGIPFFQAGEELLRSKPLDETGTTFDSNSYLSSDTVNSIKWDDIKTNQEVYHYYKGLIAFRKAHSALRMTTTADIQDNLTFMDGLDSNVVGYTIDNSPNGETAESICIIYNANNTATKVAIPEGNWNIYVKSNQAGTQVIEAVANAEVTVDPISALVLVKEDAKNPAAESVDKSDKNATADSEKSVKGSTAIYMIIAIGAVMALVAAALLTILHHNNKKK